MKPRRSEITIRKRSLPHWEDQINQRNPSGGPFRPDSDVYLIYNAGSRFQALAAGNPMNVREQKLALKITYSWSPL